MAKKINFEGIINNRSYIFNGYAEYADKVYSTLIDVVREMEVPLEVSKETFKSGGMFSGSSNEMILVEYSGLSPTYNICISVNPFGKYLGVDFYMLVEAGMFKKFAVATAGVALNRRVSTASKNLVAAKDIFEAQDISTYWAAVETCLEETFARLKFSEVKSGFLGIN